MSDSPAPLSTNLTLGSEAETANLAQRIAPVLGPGDVLLLEGPIGAGKTHFARALIQFLLARAGTVEDVPSPTFTLVQTYDAGGLEVWHSDLYRLTHVDELLELGLEEAFETAICLVEWPDRLGDLAPPNALHLRFSQAQAPDARHVCITATDPRWHERLSPLLKANAND